MSSEILHRVDVVNNRSGITVHSLLTRNGEMINEKSNQYPSHQLARKEIKDNLRTDIRLYALSKGLTIAEMGAIALIALKDLATFLSASDGQRNIDLLPLIAITALYFITNDFQAGKNNDIAIGTGVLNAVEEAQERGTPQHQKIFNLT